MIITVSKAKNGKYNYMALWTIETDYTNTYVDWFRTWKECREYFENWENIEFHKCNF